MDTPIHEAAIDGVAIAEPAAPVVRDRYGISYERALWIARSGRVAAVWLPIWAVCAAQLGGPLTSLAASVAFLLVWKAAFRRAYGDASTTVWTAGAYVPAAVGAVTGALVVLPLSAWIPAFRLSPVVLAELTLAVFLASGLWESAVASSLAARRRVLLVGADPAGVDLLEDVALAPRLPFEVVGVVDDERDMPQIAGVPVFGGSDRLTAILEQLRPQIVVLGGSAVRGEAFEPLVDAAHVGFSVVGVAEFYEYAFGRLPVRNLSPRWFLSILHLYRRPYSRLAKRTFDVVVAASALLLVAPLLPLVALLVRWTRGAILFRQRRLGEGGRPFTILKFRTMRADAETDGAVWAVERDPRITSAGRLLRRTRLDELPQLWNVLRGDMSIVGPRPERPEFVAELEAQVPFWHRRHLVKPGITGWAQVRRGYTADAAGTGEKLSYDLWYLRHRSLVVDLAICLKTVATLLTGAGAR